MNPIHCMNCGLAAAQGENFCRRCGSTLVASSHQSHGASLNQPWAPYSAPNPAPTPTAVYPVTPEYGLPQEWKRNIPPQGGGVWRDGKTLILHKNARLPDYCIKCGVPTNGSCMRRKLGWVHPALALLILAGILGLIVYAIVAGVTRKSAMVDISLCPDHIQKHRTAVIASWLVFVAGIVFLVLAIPLESWGSALFGVLLLLASAICAGTWARLVLVKKIDDYYVWLRRIDESFLSLLPAANQQ